MSVPFLPIALAPITETWYAARSLCSGIVLRGKAHLEEQRLRLLWLADRRLDRPTNLAPRRLS